MYTDPYVNRICKTKHTSEGKYANLSLLGKAIYMPATLDHYPHFLRSDLSFVVIAMPNKLCRCTQDKEKMKTGGMCRRDRGEYREDETTLEHCNSSNVSFMQNTC